MSRKSFYKTIIVIEILSDKYTVFNGLTLEDIHIMISSGDYSGDWIVRHHKEVSPNEMAKLLIGQGSDPKFFGLDEEGNDLSGI